MIHLLLPSLKKILKYNKRLTALRLRSAPESGIMYREVLTFLGQFTATSAPLAARHINILLMNQYACWPIMFGMK
jgi:hypothetical protein